MAFDRDQMGRAFTLTELLVVIAVIGILAALLLPVLKSAKQRAGGTTCANNLRQLGLAFTLYCDSNGETFPAPGSAGVYGPQREDWIWWHPGRDVTRSAVVPYLANFNATLFRCPQDSWASPKRGYAYSYSFTSYNVEDEVNPGMSTIITRDRKVYAFKMSQVKRPADKIMLVDEDSGTIDDSRWAPEYGNRIAGRHNGKGPVVFPDAHVQMVTPEFGTQEAHTKPTF